MKLDRATQQFFDSFSLEVRESGGKLQAESSVIQIYGNHLTIHAVVKDGLREHRTRLALRGDQWVGSCENDDVSAGAQAALVATMLEKLDRRGDLPEGPDTLDGRGLQDFVEERLGRELELNEEQYLAKLEKRHHRYQSTGEIYSTDLVRLHPQWPTDDLEPLSLWPTPPADILEFWNYIAYAFDRKRLRIPKFMSAVTDLESGRRKMRDWERQRELGEWSAAIGRFAAEPPKAKPRTAGLRLVITTSSAKIQISGDQSGEVEDFGPPADDAASPTSDRLTGEDDPGFRDLASSADLEAIRAEHVSGALVFDSASEILWGRFLQHWNERSDLEINLEEPSAAAVLNGIFHTPELRDLLVTLDEIHFTHAEGGLRWECRRTLTGGGGDMDEEGKAGLEEEGWALRLAMPDGSEVSHSLRLLPGPKPLYLADEHVFAGPSFWDTGTEVLPEYLIPTAALETSTGVGFLHSLDTDLPEELATRVRQRPMEVTIKADLRVSERGASSEYIHLRLTAAAEIADGVEADPTATRRELLDKDGWQVLEDGASAIVAPGGELAHYDRNALLAFPTLLEPLKPTWVEADGSFKCRVTKTFPERFADWAKRLPGRVKLDPDPEIQTLVDDPVAGAIRLEVEAADSSIDWFDLKVVVDVEGEELTEAEIKSLVNARGGFVRLKGRGWKRLQIKLGEEEREAVAKIGLDLFDLSGKTHRMHALQLADPAAKEVFDAGAWETISKTAEGLKVNVQPAPPAHLRAELRPYQAEGYHFLAYLSTNRFGGLLADDMGLGKTVQTLTWILWLRERAIDAGEKPTPALVVCPKSVLDVWAGEVIKFCPDLKVQVLRNKDELDIDHVAKDVHLLVINYAQLRSTIEDLKKILWIAAILDEGQQIKNPDSKAAKAAREISAENRLVLTGTPIENRLLDVWSLMAFAMPGILGDRSYFRDRFDRRRDPAAHRRLSARLRPFVLRRSKAQVAVDLPSRTEEDVICEMEGVQAELYQKQLDDIRQTVLGITEPGALNRNRFAVLQGLTRLRQICCHPGLIDEQHIDEESAKMQALFYHLDQLQEGGHKVLVFSQFTSMLDIIKDRLDDEDRPFHLLTGKTENRSEIVRDFQSTKDPSCFLLSLKAGGTGLNLTAASYVVLYDPWWNPAVENQAIDRTHRIGQTNPVMAYRLIAGDTVEEKIRTLQHQKSSVAQGVLSEDSFSKNLGIDDLRYLLSAGTAPDPAAEEEFIV